MDRRFSTGELHDFRMAFRLYEMIEDAFDFFQCQVKSSSGVTKHSGQSMLQALFTSMMPRQACC